MFFNCKPCLLHTGWFKKLHCIELRGVAYTTNAEARVILQSLNILLAGHDPANADSRALQAFCASASNEHVAVIKVLDVLDRTDGWGVKHFIRFIEDDAMLRLLSHADKLFELCTITRVT